MTARPPRRPRSHQPSWIRLVHSPNDIVRELERKAAVRQVKVAIATSIVSAATATLAVILSAVAVLSGR